MIVLDTIDRRLIAATQTGLPLVAEPYRAIAEQVRGALSGPGSGRAAPKIVIEA